MVVPFEKGLSKTCRKLNYLDIEMKKHLSLKQWVLALASAWLYTQHSFAGVQVSENFDANWPGAPWNATAYSNVANLVSGWSI
ncbi:MAG: hypothetical protein WCI20_14040, partial [bacterium]